MARKNKQSRITPLDDDQVLTYVDQLISDAVDYDISEIINSPIQPPNTINGGKPPIAKSDLPIDWQLLGSDPIVLPNERLAKQKDAAASVGMGMGALAEPAAALVLAFQVERGVIFTESQIKGQRKAAKALIEQKITPTLVSGSVS